VLSECLEKGVDGDTLHVVLVGEDDPQEKILLLPIMTKYSFMRQK